MNRQSRVQWVFDERREGRVDGYKSPVIHEEGVSCTSTQISTLLNEVQIEGVV